MNQRVLIIAGPTASGKSGLAVRLARKLNGEIISADSRQVYKGLNIGTGKVTRREMNGVPHHLLDVVSPKNRFTVSEFKTLAEKKITEIHKRNKLPIIVGGTGFYIDAALGKTSLPDVPPNLSLRKKLGKKNVEELFKMLKKKDPVRASTIDPKNKVRLIRALEIIEAIGRVPKQKREKPKYESIWIGLRPKDLDKKIQTRLVKRIPGMIKEAHALHKQGLSLKRMEELGLEYRHLARLLQKKIAKQEFTDQLYSEIRKYSKRQMTWFKRNRDINWFESADSAFRATTRALAEPQKPRQRG